MAGADLTVTQGRPLAMQETSEQAVYLQGALNRSSSVALVLSVGQVASCFEKEVWLGALSNANGPLRTVPKTKRRDPGDYESGRDLEDRTTATDETVIGVAASTRRAV